MFLLRVKPLFVVLLFLTVTAANASPTVPVDSTIVPTIQRVPDLQIKASVSNEAIKPVDSKLAEIGQELKTPPVISAAPIFAISTADQLPYVKSLPPVPRALLMALTGFLWVSLIKDRKVWLTALTGLLWLGQTGIQALPQLALRLSHRDHIEQQYSAELIYPYYPEGFSRLRSDIEGTRYIGLLHHLAGIPNAGFGFILNSQFSQASSIKHRLSAEASAKSEASSINKSQSALLSEQYNLNLLFKCWAYYVRHYIRFSPAFIFENLPRGPPKQA